MPGLPSVVSDADGFPEGWALGCESWSFHRQFYDRFGRPMVLGEYKLILRQIQGRKALRLLELSGGGGFYRVVLSDGVVAIVKAKSIVLLGVAPLNWAPPVIRDAPPRQPKKPKVEIVAPVVAPDPAPAPAPAAPVFASRPVRASTLTLGSAVASRALTARLQHFGIPIPAQNRSGSSS